MSQSRQFSEDRVQRTIANRYNPIRGLTPSVLTSHIQSWRSGHLRPLGMLWEEMEDRDWMLKSVIPKRKRDAARCDWQVLTEEDSPEAMAQKEFLEDFYSRLTATSILEQDQIGGVPLLVRQMMDAVGKRFAVHEIVWKPGADGSLTAHLVNVPIWFCENRTGRLRFLTADHDWNGVEMPESEWMVTVGDGLMMASCIAYLAKDLGVKDWLSLSEKFGTPIIDASTDAAQDSPEWKQLVDAVQNFAADGYIVRNRSAQIALIEVNGGGSIPQPPLVDYIDRALAALWRGADLGTKSAGDGSGQGASMQGQEMETLRADDCGLISETLWHRLEAHALRWKFGPEVKPLAYIQISPPLTIDSTKEIAVDQFLLNSGAKLGVSDTMERYNRPVPDDDEDLLKAPAPAPAAAAPAAASDPQDPEPEDPEDSSPEDMPEMPAKDAGILANVAAAQAQAIRAAFARDLQPVTDRLNNILRIEDPEIFTRKLVEFRNELPALLRDINADPTAARELELTMSRAMLDGMAGRRRAV
jgi:phage gp29-like protein